MAVGDEEAKLNLACTSAKAAFKASPSDVQARVNYEAAKAAFKAYQLEKHQRLKEASPGEQPTARKRKRPAPENAEGSDTDASTWTCDICQVTIKVAADGRARTQHLAGKNHQKKTKHATAGTDAGAGSSLRTQEKSMWSCKLCGGCTGAESARAKHMSGTKHLNRLEALRNVHDNLLRGDWVCCAKSHLPVHNYASKQVCCRAECGAPKAEGLTLEECQKLLNGSKVLKKRDRAAAWRKPLVEATGRVRQMRCRTCKSTFQFSAEQQAIYAAKGLTEPSKCQQCRRAAKEAKVEKATKPMRPAKGHKPVPKAIKRSGKEEGAAE